MYFDVFWIMLIHVLNYLVAQNAWLVWAPELSRRSGWCAVALWPSRTCHQSSGPDWLSVPGFLDGTPIGLLDFWRWRKNTKSIVTKKARDYRCSTSPKAEASLPFYSEPYRFFNLDVFECHRVARMMRMWSPFPSFPPMTKRVHTSPPCGMATLACFRLSSHFLIRSCCIFICTVALVATTSFDCLTSSLRSEFSWLKWRTWKEKKQHEEGIKSFLCCSFAFARVYWISDHCRVAWKVRNWWAHGFVRCNSHHLGHPSSWR